MFRIFFINKIVHGAHVTFLLRKNARLFNALRMHFTCLPHELHYIVAYTDK